MKLSQMQDKYAGQPAAVLGGGPSLPADLARVPKDALLIAVNYHAFEFCKPDYMVYNDQPETDPLLCSAVRGRRATLVSPDRSSDIQFDMDVWTGFYSSNTAAWFALWLGCDPVILCGMDCYQGDQKYCHPVERDVEQWHYPLAFHIRPWVEDCRGSVPHPERLRAMSGPLVPLFGAYA